MRLKEALTAACSRRRAALLKNSSGTLLRQNSSLSAFIRIGLRIISKQLTCDIFQAELALPLNFPLSLMNGGYTPRKLRKYNPCWF